MSRLTSLLILVASIAAVAAAAPADRFTEFQSARINQTHPPIFPEELVPTYSSGGQVHVLISINPEGRLEEWLVLSYTAREFAESAVAALKRWEFEPARLRGEPVGVCIDLEFNFEVKGCVVSVTPMDLVTSMLGAVLRREEYAVCTLRQLDRIPVPLTVIPPAYPQSLAERGASGDIVVEFYIDEQGNVRMPFVLGRPAMPLADLAVAAVRQWKFEPPTRRGIPVLVRARQVFRFTPAVAAGR